MQQTTNVEAFTGPSLLTIARTFEAQLVYKNQIQEPPESPHHQKRRHQPSRDKVDGIVPQPALFVPKTTETTPVRYVHRVQKGPVSTEFQASALHCSGMPVQIHPAKANRENVQSVRKIQAGIVWDVRDGYVCMTRNSSNGDFELY